MEMDGTCFWWDGGFECVHNRPDPCKNPREIAHAVSEYYRIDISRKEAAVVGLGAFDEGNVGATVGNLPSGASATDDLLTSNTASNMALLQAVNILLQRLEQPIEAKIDMFGRDKLYDSMNKANRFMKGK